LYRQSGDSAEQREFRAVDETVAAIGEQKREIRVHHESWAGDDPTDHKSIFEFLRTKIPELRRRFSGRELVIHISPGTPSMQTIWVLMAETGFVEPPFRLVKSYRKAERRGRSAVVSVELGIDTFYKIYKTTRPAQMGPDERGVSWDPAKFRTSRLRSLFAEARRFAQLNVPVLLLGERGTGKTTLAGWIRLHSPYRREEQDAHWPAVACGQYNPDTMRAELFGYTKGAFTGAASNKEGLLAVADRDSLFLDEVGDVSRDLQRLLIKVLEEKRYLPLGSDKTRTSSFRLLTATNLESEELRRRLDPDFLDRISLLTLQLPPLREIREELDWLWEDTYEEAAVRSGVPKHRGSLDAAQHRRVAAAIRNHPLPGNLRDLFRVAFHILAALSDPLEPFEPEKAVEYGLRTLETCHKSGGDASRISRAVARAFAESSSLDAVLELVDRIPTKSVERDLKAFVANELRRLSRQRGTSVSELCDVTDRALRSWAGTGINRPKTSDLRKESSDE
jgi:DNA-binding NtrC family response regulator